MTVEKSAQQDDGSKVKTAAPGNKKMWITIVAVILLMLITAGFAYMIGLNSQLQSQLNLAKTNVTKDLTTSSAGSNSSSASSSSSSTSSSVSSSESVASSTNSSSSTSSVSVSSSASASTPSSSSSASSSASFSSFVSLIPINPGLLANLCLTGTKSNLYFPNNVSDPTSKLKTSRCVTDSDVVKGVMQQYLNGPNSSEQTNGAIQLLQVKASDTSNCSGADFKLTTVYGSWPLNISFTTIQMCKDVQSLGFFPDPVVQAIKNSLVPSLTEAGAPGVVSLKLKNGTTLF